MVAALALSAPFFLAFLLVGRLQGLESETVLTAAFVSLFAGFLTLSILGTLGSDERLRARLAMSSGELATAKQGREAARFTWEAAEEERQLLEEEQQAREEREDRKRETAEQEAERRRLAEPVPCRYCRAKIDRRAKRCPACTSWLAEDAPRKAPRIKRASGAPPWVAALLSVFWPGLGHLVRGRIAVGLLLMFIVFPAVVGCGSVSAVAGLMTGGAGFVAAAVLVPILYVAIILDSASAD